MPYDPNNPFNLPAGSYAPRMGYLAGGLNDRAEQFVQQQPNGLIVVTPRYTTTTGGGVEVKTENPSPKEREQAKKAAKAPPVTLGKATGVPAPTIDPRVIADALMGGAIRGATQPAFEAIPAAVPTFVRPGYLRQK